MNVELQQLYICCVFFLFREDNQLGSTCTVGDNKKLMLRFRLYGVNTIRRVAKNDYETIPYHGDNRVDETIEAFLASTERARKAFRRQRRKFIRILAFSNGQSTPVTRRGDENYLTRGDRKDSWRQK